jgi:hypothetical protein
LSVVACVEQKIGTRELSKGDRVPKTVRWKIASRRTGSLPTDVQLSKPGFFQARPVLGAGDEVTGFAFRERSHAPTAGTLGVAMRHPVFGDVVTTAAHVLGAREFGATTFEVGHEPRVFLMNGGSERPLEGVVHRMVLAPTADYALISAPSGPPAQNLYEDREPLGLPYAPDKRDIGKRVIVLTAHGERETRLRGISARVIIDGLLFRDLLLTDFATAGGDSGSCLVDATSRVMGLLEGAVEVHGRMHSAFAPVAMPFVFEGGLFF